ncbi:hypothetical protein [Legionella tunisiensis]|uniref:hypothetical protein n=1 Tax=Legionella tunisiensis TaxID=1034944 RepID=UPI0003649ED1|nr:hypothetical protein [Legionella tunisiensis]
MFEYFAKIYNKNCSSDENWTEAQILVSQELIWNALCYKLRSLDKNKYHFAFLEFETLTMGELIDAIRHFVAQEDFYKKLYGKRNSDTEYADLINIAKLIALYEGEKIIIAFYCRTIYKRTIYLLRISFIE